MKRVLEILNFCADVLQAITKGAKTANDYWPSNNPFKRRDSSDSALPKQQGTDSKPSLSVVNKIQES